MSAARLRRRGRDRGQASLVALVGLVILAIGMYTSYNLSRSVYEKIKLQNNADATAYSLATLEARTFNLIAFTNRAQVADYVQAMEAQSLLSNMTAIEGYTGWLGDIGQCLGKLLQHNAVGPVILAAGIGLEKTSDTAGQAVNIMETAVPNYIKFQTTKNWALWAVALMNVVTTGMQVAEGGTNVVQANDPQAQIPLALRIALGIANEASFATAIDWQGMAGVHGDSTSKEALAAKRIISEITNASRYSAVAGGNNPDFLVSRGLFDVLTDFIAALVGAKGNSSGTNSALQNLSKLFNSLTDSTTKFLETDSDATLPVIDDTNKHDPGHSDLVAARALLAKDDPFLRDPISIPLNMDKNFFSVQSTPQASLHCRYKKPSKGGVLLSGYGCTGGLWGAPVRIARLFFDMKHVGFDKKNCTDDKHMWQGFLVPGGLAYYFPYASKLSGIEVEKTSFNQPDVWVFLNKPPSAMTLRGTGDLKIEMKQGKLSADLDARIGEGGVFESGVLDGMNAVARAQVYYHRPGAWQEPPNFFNPYWNARLAAKNAAINGLAARLGITDSGFGKLVTQVVADNVWME